MVDPHSAHVNFSDCDGRYSNILFLKLLDDTGMFLRAVLPSAFFWFLCYYALTTLTLVSGRALNVDYSLLNNRIELLSRINFLAESRKLLQSRAVDPVSRPAVNVILKVSYPTSTNQCSDGCR